MPEISIEFILDMEELSRNNPREVLDQFLHEELVIYETTRKTYRRLPLCRTEDELQGRWKR